jgi:Protein of unknown function (DUF2750)
MPKGVSDEEFQRDIALSGDERYDLFVQRAVEFKEVWSLKTLGGWVSMDGDDGERLMPVWPSQRHATSFASGEFALSRPAPIDLATWMERWLPGMASDEVEVAVFPVLGDKEGNVVVAPDELRRDLKKAMKG